MNPTSDPAGSDPNSETSNVNDPALDAAATDAALSETEHDSDSRSASTQTGLIPRWSWLIAGVSAAILLPIVISVVTTNFGASLPREYGVFGGEVATAEEEALNNKMMNTYMVANQTRFLVGAGTCLGIVFGVFGGIMTGRPAMGVAAAVAAVVVAVAVAMIASPLLVSAEGSAARGSNDGDIPAMIRHSVQWILISVVAMASVWVATGRLGTAGKLFGSMALAGIVGAVIYVLGGSILAPTASTAGAIPLEGSVRLLWASVPPVLGSIFMARTSPG